MSNIKLSELIEKLECLQYGMNQENNDFDVETTTYKNDPEIKVFLDKDQICVVDDLFHYPKNNEVILYVE